MLIALDCKEARRHGLLGFAFKREIAGAPGGPKWLRAQKVFRSIVPDPKAARDPVDPSQPKRFHTNEHPIQSFLWGDYTAEPDTRYKFTVVPMYGRPDALEPQPGLELEVRTEKEFDQGHGVVQPRRHREPSFAREFGNKIYNRLTTRPERQGHEVVVARLLERACDSSKRRRRATVCGSRHTSYLCAGAAGTRQRSNAASMCVSPTTTPSTATAEGRERGRDRKGQPAEKGSRRNQGVPSAHQDESRTTSSSFGSWDNTKPVAVWTGSTNFTPSGFLGQTNVGRRSTTRRRQAVPRVLGAARKDPERGRRTGALKLTPNLRR